MSFRMKNTGAYPAVVLDRHPSLASMDCLGVWLLAAEVESV